MLVDLQLALKGLLAQGVVILVPFAERFKGFYPNLFVVSRSAEFVCGLQSLEQYVKV